MTSDDLTREQAEALDAIVGRQLRFLNCFVDRMTRLGFATDDPLWLAALQVRGAAQGLFVACHYVQERGGTAGEG